MPSLPSATVEAAVLHIPILAALLVTLYLSSSAIRRATSLFLSGGRQLSDAGLRLLTAEHVLSMWLVVMLLTCHHISTEHSLVFLSAISAEATLLCCSMAARAIGKPALPVHVVRTLLPLLHFCALHYDDAKTIRATSIAVFDLFRGAMITPPPMVLGMLHGVQPCSARLRAALVQISAAVFTLGCTIWYVVDPAEAASLGVRRALVRMLVNLFVGFFLARALDGHLRRVLAAELAAEQQRSGERVRTEVTLAQRAADMHYMSLQVMLRAAEADVKLWKKRAMLFESRTSAGASVASASARASAVSAATAECCVCVARPKTHAVMPCGHRCLCDDPRCSDMGRLGWRCPICRAPATGGVVKIFD